MIEAFRPQQRSFPVAAGLVRDMKKIRLRVYSLCSLSKRRCAAPDRRSWRLTGIVVPNVRYRTDQGAPLYRELPSLEGFVRDHEAVMMQWWGYSKEHGWVVLDRSIPSNMPARNTDLMFLRCRDVAVFMEQRARWVAPAYQFEPNYIRGLPPLEADAVAAEPHRLQARWP